MSQPATADSALLLKLLTVRMPFGKYVGSAIADLPESYLLWFREKGFPQGELGRVMALALEIRINGLEGLLAPLREAVDKGGSAR